MSKVWNWLVGKKTYIIAFAAAIYGAGIQTNLWPHSVPLDLLLASAGTASLRHGISTSNSNGGDQNPPYSNIY